MTQYELYDHYFEAIKHFIIKCFNNHPDVDDFAIDVAEDTIEKFVRYGKPDENLNQRAYLFQIAKRISFDKIAKEKKYQFFSTDELDTAIEGGNDSSGWIFSQDLLDEYVENGAVSYTKSPDQELADKEMKQTVRYVVNSIPDQFSQVLKLKYFDGHSERETAEETGITLAQVKDYTHRGKRTCRAFWNIPYQAPSFLSNDLSRDKLRRVKKI